MSSEESAEEDDGRPVYMRRPLPWLKSKYRKSLRVLDKLHFESLSSKSKQMYRKRCDGEPSDRSHPDSAPSFLLEVPDEVNTSLSSVDLDQE